MEREITCVDHHFVPMSLTVNSSNRRCHNEIPRKDNCKLCRLDHRYTCEEDIKQTPPRLSQSALNTLMMCDRMHYYSYIEGLEGESTVAMQMGSLWDGVLEADHLGLDGTKFDYKGLDEFSVAKVRAMYNAYKLLSLTTQHSEQTQHKQIIRLDDRTPISVVYDRKGESYFVESKFTSSPKYYDNVWAIQDQVGTSSLFLLTLSSMP